MKRILKPIALSLLVGLSLAGCNKTNDGDEYAYEFDPTVPGLNVQVSSVEDYTSSANITLDYPGAAYYSVAKQGTSSPTSRNLFTGGTRVSFAEPTSRGISLTGLESNTTYTIFATSANTENNLNPSVTAVNFTTTDTADPTLVISGNSPGHMTGGVTPFLSDIVLTFSETIRYNEGAVTLTGFSSGEVFTIDSPSAFSASGSTLTIDLGDILLPTEDFVIITFPAGLVVDNADKPVAALSGFNYYFQTRAFTLAEQAFLMQGVYDYETIFYGPLGGFHANLVANSGFTPPTGQFELVLDETDPSGVTLRGINVFRDFGEGEPQTLRIKLQNDGTLVPNEPVNSVITAGGEGTWWRSFYLFDVAQIGGFWDFEAGTIEQWNTLAFQSDNAPLDDVDYIYTKVAEGSKGVSAREYKEIAKKRKLEYIGGNLPVYPKVTLDAN